jgi:hypothetical protein
MRKLAASILLTIAALFESIALIDPVGTKLADDQIVWTRARIASSLT